MSTIKVTRHHQLDHEHAVATADDLARSLAREFNVQCHWQGDSLHFNRRGAKGVIEVNPTSIQVLVELGFLLLPFRERIEREIHKHLDGMIEKGQPT